MTLRSLPNFRCLGGIPVAAGEIRAGQILRSGALSALDVGEEPAFKRIGIRTIIDLRRAQDRVREPDRLPAGVPCRIVAFDVAKAFNIDVDAAYWGTISRTPGVDGAVAAMRVVYAGMPAALHGWLADGLSILADPDAAPVLIHCAAGKDRTGLVIALLLHLLGATREAIMADYLASADRYPASRRFLYRRRIAERTGLTACDPICDVLTSVDTRFLEAAYSAIDHGWGDLDAYLATAGVTTTLIDRLCALHVRPTGDTPREVVNTSTKAKDFLEPCGN